MNIATKRRGRPRNPTTQAVLDLIESTPYGEPLHLSAVSGLDRKALLVALVTARRAGLRVVKVDDQWVREYVEEDQG
jgi:hypothetical protein